MVEIIAELAQGFEGKPEQARLLLKAAAKAGADAAKFQMIFADELATPDYQHYKLFRSLEMDDAVWSSLNDYAAELGIALYADIFGTKSLSLAEKIGLSTVKLHGTDISNIGFLEQVATSGVQKIQLGAGGAYAGEIEQALEILSGKHVVVLLGFQSYPTPNESNQIARVKILAEQFVKKYKNVEIGFADHASPDTPFAIALAATAIGAGAKIIEKHLTLGKVMQLEDHESALNPDEFAQFCSVIRGCAAAFGSCQSVSDFGMSEEEKGYRQMIRRHVVSIRELPANTVLSPADLTLKRASAKDVITDIEWAYGKTLKRSLQANAALATSDLD